ncbi:MAG TPA: hypothetical protein VE866_12485, partial [Candidatus Binatia bacterium]|nr:hypothetical protein [Candidatus Binatia bacterium]
TAPGQPPGPLLARILSPISSGDRPTGLLTGRAPVQHPNPKLAWPEDESISTLESEQPVAKAVRGGHGERWAIGSPAGKRVVLRW